MNNPFGIEQSNKEELLKAYHEARENFMKHFYSKNRSLYESSCAAYNKAKNACMLAGIRL